MVLDLIIRYSYAAMFAALILCGLGLPIPEELTLLGGGLLVGWNVADFWVALAVCVVAIIAGDSIVFFLGRWFGPAFLKRILSPRGVRRARIAFNKHRYKTVFFSRFVTGLRVPIYGYAGSTGMSWFKFAILDGLGALVMVPICLFIGKLIARPFGEDHEEALRRVEEFSEGIHFWLALGSGAIAICLAVILFHRWQRRRIVALADDPPDAESRREARYPISEPAEASPHATAARRNDPEAPPGA
ncbi:MAG TPA: DedA family protein [Planctomycetota bacterium]|nr:DedA family protein [Planctomycetota bacterium]